MTKLLLVFAATLILAYISEQNTKATIAAGRSYSVWHDWAYLLLVTILVLFSGLRTSYNDTHNYISIFNNLSGVASFLSNAENLHPLGNPLFYFCANLLKHMVDHAQVLIFTTSLFAQICFVRFIKRYSSNFVFSIFLYFTLGTFALSMAAMKQIVAMAVLTLAIPYLEKKKWAQYFLLVFVAMLLHTYAMAFAILPLFTGRPWKQFTYVFMITVVIMLMNFQGVVTTFLEQADEAGKTIADYEVFDNVSVNIFRLAVYAVPPLISLIFQKWIFHDSSNMDHVLVHMSIISLACMIMGTESGANMFGRMGNYFELGTICSLPWMLEKTFDKRSHHLISTVAVIAFLGYFSYANMIATDFGQAYQSVNLFEFIASLFIF
jgi:hypothetical protein